LSDQMIINILVDQKWIGFIQYFFDTRNAVSMPVQ
jgi:hypothetical protein